MDSYQGWYRDNILTNHVAAYLILEGLILYVDLKKEFALMLLIPILFIFAYTFYKANRKQFIYYKLKEKGVRKKAYLKKKSTFRTNTSYEIRLELELIDNKKIYKWYDIWAISAHDKARLDYFFEFGIWGLPFITILIDPDDEENYYVYLEPHIRDSYLKNQYLYKFVNTILLPLCIILFIRICFF